MVKKVSSGRGLWSTITYSGSRGKHERWVGVWVDKWNVDIHQPKRRRRGTATNLTDNVYSLELLFPFSQSLVDDDLKSGGGKGD